MYANITKAIHINIISKVTSDRPVLVKGTKKIIVRLIADGLWERHFVQEAENNINLQGSENKVIENDYIVDIKNIAAYIEKVEKEINVMPRRYVLNIKPQIEGSIIYDDTIIPVDTAPELSFEFSSQIMQVGEKEFVRETPIQTTVTLIQNFKFFNMEIPIITARYIFSISSLIFLSIIIFAVFINIKGNKKDSSEVSLIDKKYASKMMLIDNDIVMLNKINVNVKSIKALVQLADDKELPILRYKYSAQDNVFYYVVDGDCIYKYSAEDKTENLSLVEVSNSVSENGIEHSQ